MSYQVAITKYKQECRLPCRFDYLTVIESIRRLEGIVPNPEPARYFIVDIFEEKERRLSGLRANVVEKIRVLTELGG